MNIPIRTQTLIEIIKANNIKSFLEVGVDDGLNARQIIDATGVEYLGVDPYEHYEGYTADSKANQEYLDNAFAQAKTRVPRLFKMQFTECPVFDLDMIFIDGNHAYEYVKNDILYAQQFNPKILCGHDIHHPSVVKAVKEILGEVDTLPGRIWVARESDKIGQNRTKSDKTRQHE